MKAIEYRGQNDFYLFDEPEYEEGVGFINLRGHNYRLKLQANLSAGKKIINPEVMEIGNLLSPFTAWFNKAKPGDIFPLPENTGFEEDTKQSNPVNGPFGTFFMNEKKVIRLFLKEEPKPSPVETQDKFGVIFTNKWTDKKYIHPTVFSSEQEVNDFILKQDTTNSVLSKFTITRKP